MNPLNPPVITINANNLPLICTGPNHETWNGHPRIFLPIQPNSTIQCPYCGSKYHLDDLPNQQR